MAVRQRSPNYPGHDLGTSIEDAKRLYQKEGRAMFPLTIAATDLGFSSLHGAARVRLAALRQYGLIDHKKGSDMKLSERTLTLVLRNPASKEYLQAIKEAALEPPLFRELYETRLSSSDDALRHFLVVNAKFTDEGASRFLQAFRATMAFAGLTATAERVAEYSGGVQTKSDDIFPSHLQPEPRPGQTIAIHRERIPLRLAGGKNIVVVELPTNMTRQEWDHMMKLLEALKPGYVSNEASATNGVSDNR